jgi:hypothetical protein
MGALYSSETLVDKYVFNNKMILNTARKYSPKGRRYMGRPKMR